MAGACWGLQILAAGVAEAKQVLEAWRRDYNESRPHSSLNDMTPAEFARNIKELEPA